VFGPIAENRKALLKVIDDPQIAAAFTPSNSCNASNSSNSSNIRRSLDVGLDYEGDDSSEESGRAIETFLDWYYLDAQTSRRLAVEARIKSTLRAIQVPPLSLGVCHTYCPVMLRIADESYRAGARGGEG